MTRTLDVMTLGIDYAASTKKTACCLIDWADMSVEVLDRPMTDEALVELISSVDVAAIDIPLGWPNRFVAAIAAHAAHEQWPEGENRDQLRFRLTDRRLIVAGSMPLSVSSDRIGVGAMRAARLQTMLGEASVLVDRTGMTGKLVEVYPAAALRAWSFESRGYKGRSNRTHLRALVDDFVGACGPLRSAAQTALAEADDDDLDAFVCALLARAARTGQTLGPETEDIDIARREGWIHLPKASLSEVVQSQALPAL